MFHERRIMAYSTLTANDVRRIRTLYAEGGMFQKEIARLFGISRESVEPDRPTATLGARRLNMHWLGSRMKNTDIRGVSRHP